uniref:Uncharacterized protein n=1 Tax=Ditylenchus dipsaci TaxID=166011 RepID=A0A915DK29_9BILA
MLAVQSNRMSIVKLIMEKAIRHNKFKEVLNKQNDQGLDAMGIAIKCLDQRQLDAYISIFEEMAQLEQRRQEKRRRYSLNSRTSSRALLLRRSTTRAQSAHFSPQTMFRLNKRGNASASKESNGSRYKSVKGELSREEDEEEHSAGASDIEPEFEDTSQMHSRSSKSDYTKKSPSLQRGRSDFVIVKSEDDTLTKEPAQPKTSLPTLLNGKSENGAEILRPPPTLTCPHHKLACS